MSRPWREVDPEDLPDRELAAVRTDARASAAPSNSRWSTPTGLFLLAWQVETRDFGTK